MTSLTMIRLDEETREQVTAAAKTNRAAGAWIASPANLRPILVAETTARRIGHSDNVIADHDLENPPRRSGGSS